MRIVTEVRKRLAGLSNYDVFDWITFGFKGRTLVLNGFASRPTLKDDAGRAVKGIEDISGVDNEIKVLPLSPLDDRIRAAVYNRIYTQRALGKYNANQGIIRSCHRSRWWHWASCRRYHQQSSTRLPRYSHYREQRPRYALWSGYQQERC